MLGVELKSAVVTGGSGGIGSEIVRMLRADGLEVTAVSPEKDKLDALAAETGAEAVCMDISDHDAVTQTFASRQVDVLINCAGVLGPMSKIYETPPDTARDQVGVNLIGMLNLTRALTPGMIERNAGHIVNFGSVAGIYPILGEPFYAATKAGVHMFCQNLRMDLYGTDVRVSEILPGRVASGMHAELAGGDAALGAKRYYESYECLQPEDVADAVLYVLKAPRRVDITHLEIMPTRQVMGGARFKENDAG